MNREEIHAALFALLADVPGLVTLSRRLRHWNDVPSSEMPALFLAQGRQSVGPPAANGLPPKWLLEATAYIYVSTVDQVPGTVLNPIVDAIADLFDPNALGMPQALGGLVEHARIEGAIETSEGVLGDVEVCMIPIRLLAL